MYRVNKKIRYILVFLSCCLFFCTIYSIVRIAGIQANDSVSTLDSRVITTLIVGVDTANTDSVVFEGSTEEIKKIEYEGKEYLGYVVTQEYPNYFAFSSRIVDSLSNNNIFRGVAVNEKVGISTVAYSFIAEVNKFDASSSSAADLVIFEIAMPGKVQTVDYDGSKMVNDTVSLDLLRCQGDIISINSVQKSPYAVYYTMLFACSLCLLVLAFFIFMLTIKVTQKPSLYYNE